MMPKRYAQTNSTILSLGTLISLCMLPVNSYAEQDTIQFSGFGRIVAGQLDTDQASFRNYDHNLTFKPNSLLGLQAQAQVTQSISVVAQGLLRASEDDKHELKRLYAEIQPEDNLAIRLGRIRVPYFNYSDTIDLGYSYHWISLPHQMYGEFLFPTFDGIDVSWGYFKNDYDMSFETYLGHQDDEMNINDRTTDYDVDLFGGVIASVKKNNFEFRAAYHQGDVSIDIPQLDALAGFISSIGPYSTTADSLTTSSKVKVTQLGLRYDNFDYFAGVEWVHVTPEVNTYMSEIDTYYITGGYVLSSIPVTLHLTYGHSDVSFEDFPDEMNQALSNTPQDSPIYAALAQSVYGLNTIMASRSTNSLDTWTIGARWDIRPKIALKADVTFLQGDKNEAAMFQDIEDGFDRKAQLYQVALEWVF